MVNLPQLLRDKFYSRLFFRVKGLTARGRPGNEASGVPVLSTGLECSMTKGLSRGCIGQNSRCKIHAEFVIIMHIQG